MSAQLSPNVLSALRPSAEAPARLATEGLSSPGSVAGQFAAMLATLRDGGAAATETGGATATVGAQQTLQPLQQSAGPVTSGEHKVASSVVSLLMQDLGDAAANTDGASAGEVVPSRRRRQAPADLSNQVVEGTVNRGAPISAPWMATLMAAGMAAATQDAAA